MSAPARRSRSVFPDLSEFFDTFGFPQLRPFGSNLIRIEDKVEDNRYIVRAELPGLDPGKDIDVSIEHGRLEIGAERSEEKSEGGHSEFSYGSFRRSVPLPAGAKEDDIEATYAKGILTVTVGLGDSSDASRKIDVKNAD
ncbi:HSP20 family molecular chaperone IbpA [Rhodococcus sp. SMB37]|uniref:Hsp20/alpha crystallin family protein n=1 Tax=Rhodococcus sp. SMB37 TaxID=2512213 RepID=UPI001048B557|nr:Hsp20/alpha crystallin family protein [Rhodococcus sp. SMB37]TCN42468.1 HSP20 family molecular chaperone IbpA [Rhodococcus sp. SMB37]